MVLRRNPKNCLSILYDKNSPPSSKCLIFFIMYRLIQLYIIILDKSIMLFIFVVSLRHKRYKK